MDAGLVQAKVPAGLTVDTFGGRAFVGVVAFTMQNVRPYLWAPPFPTARQFGEINVRTYVHRGGEEPGVFFFSLDATSSLAVWAARTLWQLPYYRSDIDIDDAGPRVSYQLTRRAPPVQWTARARLGAPVLPALQAPLQAEGLAGNREGEATPADTNSLEFFLAERYQFYVHRRGRLQRARVHHAPYPLHVAEVPHIDGTLVEAAGFPSGGARPPDYFSPGVDVDVYALEDV